MFDSFKDFVRNKPRTAKDGAILKAQKVQKRGPFELFKNPVFAKYEKTEGGTLWRLQKILEKKSHKAEKSGKSHSVGKSRKG